MNEENNENIKEQETQEPKRFKIGFFKKIWYSITKIERYGDMATEGVPRAISYIVKLALIMSIVVGIGTSYQISNVINEGKGYIENNIEDFEYKDGILDVKNAETLILENTSIGKIIIDTKTEDNNLVNDYLNSITDDFGVVVLKNQLILKGIATSGTVSYKYKDILGQMQITNLTKEGVINYINSNQMWSIYLSIFGMILVYSLILYVISILWNTVIISIFGLIAAWFAKIKMRYVAIFNMSAYALTLSVLLNVIYIAVNIFIDFNITYFQVMYFAVAAIYLIAAIFIIKSEFIKRQIEISKMVEIKKQEKEKQKEEEQEKERQEKESNKQPKDKEKDKEKNKDKKDNGQEPEGSGA